MRFRERLVERLGGQAPPPVPSETAPPVPHREPVVRVSRRETLVVAALLTALIALFFYDVVFLGRTLMTATLHAGVMGEAPPYGYEGPREGNIHLLDPLAPASISEPAIRATGDSIRQLRLPLWDAHMALGRPLLASADTTVGSPMRLPLMLWPSAEMWDVFLLARFLVAGLFTYLLARRLRLSATAAFTSAAAFIFSGYFMLYLNHPHTDYAAMLPVVVYALELLVERPGPGRLAGTSLAIALAFLANNPQAGVVVLMYGGTYALARMVALARMEGARWQPRLAHVGAAMVAGLGLTGFAMGPLLELLGLPGSGGLAVHLHDVGLRRGLAADPPGALISLFSPYFDGSPRLNLQGTGWSGIRNYVGSVVPVLGVAAFWHRQGMRRVGWFCLGSAVVLLAKTYGFPLVNWIGALPVLDVMDFAQYVAPAVALSLAILAGLGVEQLTSRKTRWVPIVAGAAALLVLLSVLVWVNRSLLPEIPVGHLTIQFGMAALLVGAVVAVSLAAGRGLLGRPGAGALVAAIVTVELFAFTLPMKEELAGVVRTFYQGFNINFIARPARYDPFTEPPYVRFLRSDRSKYRVLGLNLVLHPNSSMVFGIDDVRGFTAATNERYWRYINEFVSPLPAHRFTRAFVWQIESGDPPLAGNPLMDLLNVKYLVVPATHSLPGEKAASGQFRLVYDREVKVYENTNAFPRVFLVSHAVEVPDVEEAVRQMRRGFDPARTAVVEGRLPAAAQEILHGSASGVEGSSVRITEYGHTRVRIRASVEAPALLVLADAFYPGWRVSVDGERRPIYAADVALRAVYLEPGDREVSFDYAPASFAFGSLATGISAFGLAVYAAARRWTRRRRTPTSPPGPSSPEPS